MADNYVQFSEVVPNLTKEEEAWWEHQLQWIAVVDGVEREVDADEGEPDGATYFGFRIFREPAERGECDQSDYLGFQHSFCTDEDQPGWGRHLWIYAEDSGDPDGAALAVQQFLKRFRSRESWSLTFAATCSRPRVGEFSGGGVFVTAAEIKWQNGHDFIAQCQSEFDATLPAKPA